MDDSYDRGCYEVEEECARTEVLFSCLMLSDGVG